MRAFSTYTRPRHVRSFRFPDHRVNEGWWVLVASLLENTWTFEWHSSGELTGWLLASLSFLFPFVDIGLCLPSLGSFVVRICVRFQRQIQVPPHPRSRLTFCPPGLLQVVLPNSRRRRHPLVHSRFFLWDTNCSTARGACLLPVQFNVEVPVFSSPTHRTSVDPEKAISTTFVPD